MVAYSLRERRVFAPPTLVSSCTLSHTASYQMCVYVSQGNVCICVCPYLKTSGSGPIRSGEMVGISGLNQDLRCKEGRGEIALGR